MSRGLVLVKWWLLALPHYLILSVKVGGELWLSTGSTDVSDAGWGAGGLVGLLCSSPLSPCCSQVATPAPCTA